MKRLTESPSWPVNKWWASFVVGIGAILTTWLEASPPHGWSRTETVISIGFVVQMAVMWITGNDDSPIVKAKHILAEHKAEK